jgi:hypothetical protein
VSAPREILDLVARFEQQLDAYKSGQYNETQLRREFLDPFFKALGWDIDNEQGYAEAYKDVIHEDAIRMGSATKAPDYCFRIGGARKFFLEAKKPSSQLATFKMVMALVKYSQELMADVFSKRKRSQVMAAIRSRGNKDTELKLASIFREHGIKGWRRHLPLPGNT